MARTDDGSLPPLPVRYRWRYGIAWGRLLGWTMLSAFVLGLFVARGVADGRPEVGAILGVLAVAVGAVLSIDQPGVLVTERQQPDLDRLVRTVAARTGLPAPDRVWLTHTAEITARVRLTRRGLLIGRGAVPCLTEPELSSLVAHELAILQFRWPRLVSRVTTVWSAAAAIAKRPSPSARAVRLATDLRAFGVAVHAAADAAAAHPPAAARWPHAL